MHAIKYPIGFLQSNGNLDVFNNKNHVIGKMHGMKEEEVNNSEYNAKYLI